MIKRKKCGQQYDDELNARHKCETDSSTTDTSSFSNQQQPFQDSTPVLTTGATSDCYRVKLYGKLHFLKRLKPEFSGNPRYRAAMRKEFETGYNLDHPNLVRYMSCGDDYLLTEWVDGITLGEFVEQNPEFFKNRDRVSNLLDELLGVVEYLHSHQIVHLDLKPDNILITRVGQEVKLTDLGFCYTDTFNDTMGHTGPFAAPEQLDGSGNVDARTDVYALGRIIATLPCATKYKRVIEKCTAHSKEDRYQSATLLRKELTRSSNRRKKLRKIMGRWGVSRIILLTLLTLVAFSYTRNCIKNHKEYKKNAEHDGEVIIHLNDSTTDTLRHPTPQQFEAAMHRFDEMENPDDSTYFGKDIEVIIANGSINNTITINEDALIEMILNRTDLIYEKYDKLTEGAKDPRAINQQRDKEIDAAIKDIYNKSYKPSGLPLYIYNYIASKALSYYQDESENESNN